MSKLDLSIIIVSWNTKDLIRECLQSIYQTVKDLNFEVIVIDNASTDKSADMVEKEFPAVKLIRNRENAGYARANNQGIRNSCGEFIMCLNPDTVLKKDSVVHMVKMLRENKDLGAVGPILKTSDNTPQISYGRFPTIPNMLALHILPYKLARALKLHTAGMVVSDGTGLSEVDYVSGACFIIRKEIVERIGELDEDFFAYFEETDFFYRMKSKGAKIAIDKSAEVIHIRDQSLGQLGAEKVKIFYESLIKYFSKNKGYFKTILLRFLLAISCVSFIVLLPLAYLSSRRRPRIGEMFRLRWVILKTALAGK